MTTILFADDNRSIREYCSRELEEEGYRVVGARDGGEALRLIGRFPPDLVVLDICMPGIDGLEAAARIRATQRDLPIILFTSYDDACTRDERSSCATACVEKREDLTELKNVIAAALRSRGQNLPYRLGLPPAALSVSTTP
jgi:CheY-like chemotaxis protein